ncbi:hypothetical protein [Peribacillus sp. NPDC097895]|uniref:hypothetical protein n=1 Tax=Peribacillus sp. NPDC097895 TaxID=3390619 RepID=UPI003D077789
MLHMNPPFLSSLSFRQEDIILLYSLGITFECFFYKKLSFILADIAANIRNECSMAGHSIISGGHILKRTSLFEKGRYKPWEESPDQLNKMKITNFGGLFFARKSFIERSQGLIIIGYVYGHEIKKDDPCSIRRSSS